MGRGWSCEIPYNWSSPNSKNYLDQIVNSGDVEEFWGGERIQQWLDKNVSLKVITSIREVTNWNSRKA